MEKKLRARLALAQVSLAEGANDPAVGQAQARFEVLAITAGEGNGWVFSEACLRESLPLWDGAECFVDHAGTGGTGVPGGPGGRSVRDLAGVFSAPVWDAARRGIRCQLKAIGPSGPLLSALGRELVGGGLPEGGSPARQPRVGFSVDVVFTGEGRAVRKILRVLSVDLVFNPARGGAFLRALDAANSDSTRGSAGMAEQVQGTEAKGVNPPAAQTVQQAQLGQTAESADAAVQQAREQMCGYLLESALAAARLPQPAAEQLRRQFAGRVFAPGELSAAVEDTRRLVSELTAGAVVQGLGRVHSMVSAEEQFGAALHDLLGAERPPEWSKVHAARLSGIRELYTLMTGDVDFAGGYDPARAQFATTADLPGVLKNAMNKLIVQEWQALGRSGYRWWEPLVSVEHFNSLQDITGLLVGEVAVLPAVAEAAPYPNLGVADSAEVGQWQKYGGYVGLTLEMFERDETHRLRMFPRKLAAAGLRRVSALVGAVFTANAGTGPQMSDGLNVFAAGHGNLGALALSGANWESASSAIYNQPMVVDAGVTAPVLALDAKYLVVPRALRLAAMRILYPSWEREANLVSENMQQGQMGDVITCPEMSDPNDWAALADPKLAPAIIVGERFGLLPEIIMADREMHGALFTNDELRMKARHWLAVFVADHRPLYKSNAA